MRPQGPSPHHDIGGFFANAAGYVREYHYEVSQTPLVTIGSCAPNVQQGKSEGQAVVRAWLQEASVR